MEVLVTIQTEGHARRDRIDALKRAAARLTDDKTSIRVTQEGEEDLYSIVTKFSMRDVPQGKVVDEVFAVFKQATWDFHDYVDMTVEFSREGRRRRRRRVPSS